MRRIASVAAALLVVGCTPPDVRPALTPRASTDLGLSGPPATAIDAMWWRAFGDAQLDRIVADALSGSPTLDAALARVRQAQATLAARDSEDAPQVAFDGSAQVSRLSGESTIPPPFRGTVRSQGNVQAGLNWNLDLFGRQKTAIEGARASMDAARLDAEAARLMLAGSVVQAYAELARAEQQGAIATQTIATRQRSARLVDVRLRNRLASRIDVQAAGTLLAQARVARVRAAAARILAANALAALAGRGADYPATIGVTSLSANAALLLPATIPADLLSRRADVAAAQARIAAAAAGRQVARRAFYPNINLTALVGLQAVGLQNLLDINAGTVGSGAAIHLPIFDGGRLKADLAGATAALDLAIADYDRIVIAAVREAADALTQVGATDAERAAQAEVVRGYAETARLNAVRVSSGLDSRLVGIDNDVRQLEAEQTAANLATDALSRRAALAVALGGGFDPSRNPTP